MGLRLILVARFGSGPIALAGNCLILLAVLEDEGVCVREMLFATAVACPTWASS